MLYLAWMLYFRLDLSLGPRVIFQPWAIHKGFLIYEQLGDIHTPLLPLILSAGQYLIADPLKVARLALVGFHLSTLILIFLIGRKHINIWAGLAAAMLYILWSPSFSLGKLWYESLLTPLYLVYPLLYRPSAQPRPARYRLLWGLFAGVTVLVKQQAAAVFAFFLIWEIITGLNLGRPLRSLLKEAFLTGIVSFIPLGLMILYQGLRAGSVEWIAYWMITYHLDGTYTELAARAATDRQIQLLVQVGLLLLPALIYAVNLFRRKDFAWQPPGFWLGILFIASLALYPRFEMFHLLPALPLVALLSAWVLRHALVYSARGAREFSAGIALALIVLWLISAGGAHLAALEPTRERRIDEFSQLVPLAKKIQNSIATPYQSIFIFPDDESTANLYYLLDTPPHGYWMFHYPWYMTEKLKYQILTAFQQSPAEWVVYFPGRWEVEKYAPEIVQYLQTHYQVHKELTLQNAPVLLLRRAATP